MRPPKNNKFIEKGDIIVKVDKKYLRPTETDSLQGDFKKAKDILGWKPEISFKELIKEMIEHDIHEAQLESIFEKHRDKEKLTHVIISISH